MAHKVVDFFPPKNGLLNDFLIPIIGASKGVRYDYSGSHHGSLGVVFGERQCYLLILEANFSYFGFSHFSYQTSSDRSDAKEGVGIDGVLNRSAEVFAGDREAFVRFIKQNCVKGYESIVERAIALVPTSEICRVLNGCDEISRLPYQEVVRKTGLKCERISSQTRSARARRLTSRSKGLRKIRLNATAQRVAVWCRESNIPILFVSGGSYQYGVSCRIGSRLVAASAGNIDQTDADDYSVIVRDRDRVLLQVRFA